ncbi:MAG: VCBS repeat-containing protein [Chitinophagaceae bacterium]|nr:VCBS repeat-containing protein [Chitinophagaceae bacterium]
MRRIVLLVCSVVLAQWALATGEPSTYFQIFVPPNNDAVRRDAALIITAIYDSTSFDIIDDGADGDTDDSKKGMLMAGQSYVLYIRDNGINDDARYASGGVLKWDGDYFIVKSDKLLFASQSTNSDWQHDWVPSTDKKSIGQKFIIYSPVFSSSKRDVNVMAYENNTTVTFQKISFQPKTNTGYTDVKMEEPTTIFTRKINIGEDLIYKNTDGRDVMAAGETYLLLSDKPVTVQYGALFGNERDGGGYVPSSNGSSSGDLLYFTVPYQAAGEQEIRIASWDDKNDIKLERYSNGQWIELRNYSLNKMQAADWVGRNFSNATFNTVFRITCTPGKRVSVFEGNWFETGSPGTSDMGTMVSAENGTTSGTRFLTYMAPPGNEANVINPFTGKAFGQRLTHLYIFAKEGATVTVKDAYSNGAELKRSFTIGAERYYDFYLTETEWKNIYNGTATNVGPERPYLLVETDKPVAVMNTNFNDNWMLYTGSSLTQAFTQNSEVSQSTAIPADTVTVTSTINTGSGVDKPTIEVIVQDGLKVVESTITNPDSTIHKGTITEEATKTVVSFNEVGTLKADEQYTVTTKVTAEVGANTGQVLSGPTNSTVETIVTGNVNGQIQQSSTTAVVNVNPSNTSKLIFSKYADNLINKDSTDSWTASWGDLNNDGWDDLFVTDRRLNKPNIAYLNNKQGGFTKMTNSQLVTDTGVTVSNSLIDIDNDGDIDVLAVNNTRHSNYFYTNVDGVFIRNKAVSFAETISYYHGAAFADYDNDGNNDLFLCNFFPTKYNELHRNFGSNTFKKEIADVIPTEANQSVGPTWADYDNDGFQDLFVPNGAGNKNSLFHNEGNGTFTKVQNAITAEGGQSVGSAWGDYDNDGDLDLIVTNSNKTGNFLYRNEGAGVFTKITNSPVATDKGASHGCSWADIDNDGDLDLYISNDKSYKFLYINDGKGGFTRKNDELVSYDFGNSFGHVWADYDHDGDLDMFVATHSNQPNVLFYNNGNSNNWISIKLTGVNANKNAIGARIYVDTENGMQMREVNAQSGFGGQSSLTQHIGLGNASAIRSITIVWPGGHREEITNVGINQLLSITEGTTIAIKAAVFFDANGNCQKDANEELMPRAAATVLRRTAMAGNTPNAGEKFISNDEGWIKMNLPAGNYSMQLLNEKQVTAGNCGPLEINIATNTTDTIWLPAQPTCSGSNASLLMGSTAIRKGMTNNQMTLVATNKGRSTATRLIINWKVPATIIPGTFNTTPFNVIASTENGVAMKTYQWEVTQLQPFRSNTIQFMHSNSSTVQIGNEIPMMAWLDGNQSNCSIGADTLRQTYKVVGAIDPNDIQVAPTGYGKEGLIHPTQELTYTIRFENVGNHPASDVVITDELPAGIDMSTLNIVSSSHEMSSMQVNNQKVTFSFENIFLPDSASSKEGSQGYIMFTVKPVTGIAAGTKLRNKASIQFDHYEAITTNEVLNTIQSAAQEQEEITVETWPNPAMDVVYINLKHKKGKYTRKSIRRVEFVDMNGRIIFSKMFGPNDEQRINIPETLNGFYMLKITDSDGKMYTHKIFVRKTM